MLEKLKERVYLANIDLVEKGLVIQTWGNASGRDPDSGFIVIKPSGVAYDRMTPDDMVVLSADGKKIEGSHKPSTDTPTHIELYRAFEGMGGIVHTHSTYATSWAQAGKEIPPFGTTHADHYHGSVPCTRKMSGKEIIKDYEANTGKVIIEKLNESGPAEVSSILVHSHGPFSWGNDPETAVCNAVALEEIARMAFYTVLLGRTEPIDGTLLDKHYFRKHGKGAYYGQK
ncbi:MAG TPA: L-ribulose-5-phosphate 4-epimerase AraD [Bacteroidales bacterium]|nr:L-ribulose-5-phosphate 4-epimerase AraD [Bacteroidales bacterium]